MTRYAQQVHLLLDFSSLRNWLRPGVSNVFLLNYARKRPADGWTWLKKAADREGISVGALHDEVRVTPRELAGTILT
jgi:hypothetical protein